MSQPKTLLVATDGQAVLRSHDEGATWRRIKVDQDLEFDDCVRCLLPDPRNPQSVFAGAETGLFRSDDCGANWHRIDCELNSYAVWKLVVIPSHPEIMYAGTGSPTRSAFFRSRDGGENMGEDFSGDAAEMRRRQPAAHVDDRIDPDDVRDVWVGVEEGGLFRTRDGGDSWQRVDANRVGGVRNSDVHSIAVLRGPPKTVVVMVVNALYTSTDDGETWSETNVRDKFGIYYSRVLASKPAAIRTFTWASGMARRAPLPCCCARGSRHDVGQCALPCSAELHDLGDRDQPVGPEPLLAGTKYGDLFRSNDGGYSWRKEWREFPEITDVTWLAAVPSRIEEPGHAHP